MFKFLYACIACFAFQYTVSVIALFYIMVFGCLYLFSPHSILQFLFWLYSIFYILSSGCSNCILQFQFLAFYTITIFCIPFSGFWMLYSYLPPSPYICYCSICHCDILHSLILQLVLSATSYVICCLYH